MIGFRFNRRQSGAGFTLIEVIITMAVFSIASLMAVNLFVIFVQQQRRTLNQQELQNDTRAVIEAIAKDLREGSVDYAYYASQFSGEPTKLFSPLTGSGEECLVLRDALNAQILYRLNVIGTTKTIQRVVPTTPITSTCSSLSTSVSPAPKFEDISPASLSVSTFKFFISPSEDPFAAKSALQCDTLVQPGVPVDGNCRWGTICAEPTSSSTCINPRDTSCYCFPQKFGTVAPLHPRVTFSLEASRTSNGQIVSQIFQTTIASRIFKNVGSLNSYVP